MLQKLWRDRACYVMLSLFFIPFTLFTICPVAASLGFSFTRFNMLQAPVFIGLQNYFRLFLEDDIFPQALGNTLVFAAVTGPLSYALCLLFAWIINEFKGWLRAALTLVFYAPSICGQAYLVWGVILSGDRYGYLNGILLALGFLDKPVLWMRQEESVMPILMAVQLWMSLGTGFLAFIAGLQTIDKSLYEAAAIDGVGNRWQELYHVTLPSMLPQLRFGAVMQITASFSVADISLQLAGNPSVNYAGATVGTHLMDYGGTRFDMGYASAIATVLFFLMMGSNALAQKALRRVGS